MDSSAHHGKTPMTQAKPMHLLAMAVLHFVAMYALMYVMVDEFGNVYSNLNQAYMAGLMTAPMLMLEALLMRSMYANRKMLNGVLAASVLVFLALFVFIRDQTAIADRSLLASMIPHHAGAILMCQRATLADAEVQALCETIVASQQKEISFMKQKLEELDRRRNLRQTAGTEH